jgi:hypothetical protein
MKHLKLFALLGALATLASAQVSYTTIQDMLVPGFNGAPVNGNIDFSWTAFDYGGAPIAAGNSRYTVTAGVVNVRLVANDQNGVTPAYYKVTTKIGGTAQTSFWQVPTLPSTRCVASSYCTIKEVTVYPPGPDVTLNFGMLMDGIYCMTVEHETILSITASCSGSGTSGAISWVVMTSSQWAALTASEWQALTP